MTAAVTSWRLAWKDRPCSGVDCTSCGPHLANFGGLRRMAIWEDLQACGSRRFREGWMERREGASTFPASFLCLASEHSTKVPSGDVDALCWQGRVKEALDALDLMDKQGIRASQSSYGRLLQGCVKKKQLAEAKRLYFHIVRNRLDRDRYLGNAAIDMFVKCGSLPDALRLFEKLPLRTAVGWTAVISGYVNAGQAHKALEKYHAMLEAGAEPNRLTFLSVLKACSSLENLEEGRQVHSRLARSGIDSDVFVSTSLIDMYAKCGSMVDARHVFEGLRVRDVPSWNAMIAGYAYQRQGDIAFQLYERMLEEGVKPDNRTFVGLLKACGNVKGAMGMEGWSARVECVERIKLIHAEAGRSGYGSDLFFGNTLIHLYAKYGMLSNAQQVFDTLPHPTVVSWTVMIAAYAQDDQGAEAMRLYDRMQECGVKPDSQTMVSVLKACCIAIGKEQVSLVDGQLIKVESVKRVKKIHTKIIHSGYELDLFVGTTLVDMYAKCGSMTDAMQVFVRLPKCNVVSWNAMIAGYTQQEQGDKALQFYDQMQEQGTKADDRTFVSVLKAIGTLACMEQQTLVCGQLSRGECLQRGKEIHAEVVKRGYESDIFVGNTLLDMYANCESMVDARIVFDTMPQRDVVSWNAMIAGYSQEEEGARALDMFDQMLEEGVAPNKRTFASVLKACCKLTTFAEKNAIDGKSVVSEGELRGRLIHQDVVRMGYESDIFIANSLIYMYGKLGHIVDAKRIFETLPWRDVVSWNSMLAGYVQQDRADSALELYIQMQETGVKPDKATFLSILKACGQLGALQLCREVHDAIIKSSLPWTSNLVAALLHAYCKCGSMLDAANLFDGRPKQDLVMWNVLIGGYARQGEWQLSLKAFEDMQQAGFLPNEVTFLAVLVACGHAGMVDRGVECFETMTRELGISATSLHYASLADLLGRAGLISQAENLLLAMPMQPCLSMWLSLLGACRTYNNVEVGKRAFENAVELEPKDSGPYVLMANIYAQAEMWDNQQMVHELRMRAGAWKEPGKCWIESGGKVDLFLAGDTKHQHSRQIYAKLKELNGQLKEKGCVTLSQGVIRNENSP